MKLWNADDESLDLMEAAAEMSIAAMRARSRRADPDGVISASHGMSAVKLREALGELRAPHVKEWHEFTDEEKAAWYEALETFTAQKDDGFRSAAFKRLRHAGLCRPPFTREIRERNDGASPAEEGGTDAKIAEVLEAGKRVL